MSENIIPLEKLKFIINNIENHITKSDAPSRGNLSFLYIILVTFLCFFTYHFYFVCLLDILES